MGAIIQIAGEMMVVSEDMLANLPVELGVWQPILANERNLALHYSPVLPLMSAGETIMSPSATFSPLLSRYAPRMLLENTLHGLDSGSVGDKGATSIVVVLSMVALIDP